MIFSEQWIREWVNPPLTTQQLVDQLTMAGLEVDSIAPVASSCSDAVVAEIVGAEPHLDADRLRVCQANDGTQPLQVVCGAPNARLGIRVPFATVGATLQSQDSEIKIRKAKLRGIESNGMLCSAEELGLAESADGLLELPADAPLGQDIRQYLSLDDSCIELDLTPNRADCLGIIGLAREIGTLNRLAAVQPDMPA